MDIRHLGERLNGLVNRRLLLLRQLPQLLEGPCLPLNRVQYAPEFDESMVWLSISIIKINTYIFPLNLIAKNPAAIPEYFEARRMSKSKHDESWRQNA